MQGAQAPDNNALEQTVGATRKLEARPAAQRERSPDNRSVEEDRENDQMATSTAWRRP